MAYHLVDFSPWPLMASYGVLNLAIALVAYMHKFNNLLILMALLCIVLIAIIWWRDVIRESLYLGHHTLHVLNGLALGVILFIVSEVMLFISFFWALFHNSLSPGIELACNWPPRGVMTLDKYSVALLNTLILLSSGASLTWAHHNIVKGNKNMLGLHITLVLAVIFTILQGVEYYTCNFNITDSVYGTTFYSLTGLHGFHVIVGTIYLAVTALRISEITKNHHIGFETASWYWHFVDVVWLIVFVVVY